MGNIVIYISILNKLSKKILSELVQNAFTVRKSFTSTKETFKETIRGTYGNTYSKDVVKVKLNDNTAVKIATNKVKAAPCVRLKDDTFPKTKKKNIMFTLVQPFQTYNKRILGVYLYDLFVLII